VVAVTPVVALITTAPVSSDAADPAPASTKSSGVHIVRTVCPDGRQPTPNHSGCWCGDDSMPPASRMVAPAPADPSCRPTERSDGPYCLWSCGYPMPGTKPAKAATKPPAPTCRSGLGKPVPCIGDDDFACAMDDYQWKPPPGGPCDSPPGPADRVYRSVQPTAAAPSQLSSQAETFVPPPVVGEVYIAVDYNNQAGHPIATNIAVAWGNWQHHAVLAPAPGARGVVLELRHTGADSVPLLVATDGAIVAGPMQSAPLKLPGYAQIQW
jgi:hypothetical protein